MPPCGTKIVASLHARLARQGFARHLIRFEAGFAPSSSPCVDEPLTPWVYRHAERTALRRFFFAGGRAEAAWGGSGKEKSFRYFLPKAEKFFSGAAGIFWRRGRKKRPVSRWWATGRFAVFQRRNEVRYTKLPHSAGDIYNVPHLFAQIN